MADQAGRGLTGPGASPGPPASVFGRPQRLDHRPRPRRAPGDLHPAGGTAPPGRRGRFLCPETTQESWTTVSVPGTPGTGRSRGYYTSHGPHLNTRENIDTTQGVGWYQPDLHPAGHVQGQGRWLQFDAASRKASVRLNGVHLGDHAGGLRFRPGRQPGDQARQPNLLVVKVDASKPVAGGLTADTLPLGGDFFIHGGLYRSVSLVGTDKVHFDMLDFGGPGVYARTTLIKDGAAKVAVRARLRNDAALRAPDLVTQLVDATGAVAAEAKSPSTEGRCRDRDPAGPRPWPRPTCGRA
ncbi:hypothetical protein ACRAWD_27490 [Caulobacter segnis]